MSTIALKQANYATNEKQVSLKERMARYFQENRREISTALYALNVNNNSYETYRLLSSK